MELGSALDRGDGGGNTVGKSSDKWTEAAMVIHCTGETLGRALHVKVCSLGSVLEFTHWL